MPCGIYFYNNLKAFNKSKTYIFVIGKDRKKNLGNLYDMLEMSWRRNFINKYLKLSE